MKYLIYWLLYGLFLLILFPIMLIKWNARGWDKIEIGLQDMCDVEFY